MEKLKVKGIFKLREFRNGQLFREYEDNNLVVNLGRNAVAALLGNTDPIKYITDISFGESGITPTSLDTAITTPFMKNVASVSYPTTGEAKFDWALELTEDNGVTILEFGLHCSDGTLFARKTGVSVVKDNTVRLEGSWSIIF